MRKIPAVTAAGYGSYDGAIAGTGDVMAGNKFLEVFGAHEYSDYWDQVKKKYDCFCPADQIAWARGMNNIIGVLNNLPEPCSRDEFLSAFGI